MVRRILPGAVTMMLMVTAFLAFTAPHAAAASPCSRGMVALTFDDGPNPAQTPRLLDILRQRHVRATFFMTGRRVAANPGLARRVAREGHVVGNHSWGHPKLTWLSDARIRDQMRGTRSALRRAGASPSNLMRPPYGAIDGRVRAVLRNLDLRPVLWDIDTRDWESGNAAAISRRIIDGLRPGMGNIVLQHDGVPRSGHSVDAVSRTIVEARRRGYCFAPLASDGRPLVPVPRLTASTRAGLERGSTPMRIVLSLDRPTPRRTDVLLTSLASTATPGVDYRTTSLRVSFGPGVTRRVIDVAVRNDSVVEATERAVFRLSGPRGLTLGVRRLVVPIVSDDVAAAPKQSPTAAAVTEVPFGSFSTTR